MKISYSCMPNMKSVFKIITLIQYQTSLRGRSNNCRQKSECPLNKEYLSESLVYKVAVSQTPSQINKYYYGTCEKLSKNDTTIMLLHSGIKANRKIQNSLSIPGTKGKQHPAPNQLRYESSFKSWPLQCLHTEMRRTFDRENTDNKGRSFFST